MTGDCHIIAGKVGHSLLTSQTPLSIIAPPAKSHGVNLSPTRKYAMTILPGLKELEHGNPCNCKYREGPEP